MRLKCLACESLARPVYHCAARSPHSVDVELVPRHLHRPAEIRARLQELIDAAGGCGYEAVALAYGLCGQTTSDLVARSIPLVIPRAHDCITLFLGGRDRYAQEFARQPGTYWYARDYLERADGGSLALAMGAGVEDDTRALYEKYVEKYCREKADRLMEVMDDWLSHFKRAVYLDTGLDEEERYEALARAEAGRRGWAFERLPADLSLIQRLLDGEWGADFLVVPPSHKIAMSFDDEIISAKEV